MSLEHYFNHKKSVLVTFFTNFQQILHELSIVVQLEIDNQYFTAKNIMSGAGQDLVEGYCREMMGKETGLLRKIVQAVFQKITEYCGNEAKGKVWEEGGKYSESNPEKIERKIVESNANQINKINEIGKRSMSLGRLQGSEQSTAQKLKNVHGVETVSRNSMQLFNLKTKTKQQAGPNYSKQNTQQAQKIALPINLLNRKRQNSSRKCQQQASRRDSGSQIKNPSKMISRNFSGHIQPYSIENSRQAPGQIHQKLSYEKYRQIHSKNQREGVLRQKPIIHQSNCSTFNDVIDTKDYQNDGIITTNQSLCEKLDQKIQESAMEILNKVKPKRSPPRKKTYQSANKINRTINTFSSMDYSHDPKLLTRPNILRLQK